MGGPGSGRRAGSKTTGKKGITSAKTPEQYAKRTGISLTRAKTVFAKNKSLVKKKISTIRKKDRAMDKFRLG